MALLIRFEHWKTVPALPDNLIRLTLTLLIIYTLSSLFLATFIDFPHKSRSSQLYFLCCTCSETYCDYLFQKSEQNQTQTRKYTISKECTWNICITVRVSQQYVCVFIIQVPLGDWAGTLGRGRAKGTEIPCRRMRSGSYVKAMGDLEDSEDSEGSPKPSPKSAARRHSYLKATQHSLSEQQPPPPPRKWVPQHRESNSSYWNYWLSLLIVLP